MLIQLFGDLIGKFPPGAVPLIDFGSPEVKGDESFKWRGFPRSWRACGLHAVGDGVNLVKIQFARLGDWSVDGLIFAVTRRLCSEGDSCQEQEKASRGSSRKLAVQMLLCLSLCKTN